MLDVDDDFDSGKGDEDAGAVNTGTVLLPVMCGGDDTRPSMVIVLGVSVPEGGALVVTDRGAGGCAVESTGAAGVSDPDGVTDVVDPPGPNACPCVVVLVSLRDKVDVASDIVSRFPLLLLLLLAPMLAWAVSVPEIPMVSGLAIWVNGIKVEVAAGVGGAEDV